jgi:uncharacterized damage-inducible protein DinB
MSTISKEQLIVQPFQCRSPVVGRWIWALEDTRRRTLSSLEGLGVDDFEALDWVSPINGNSIGTLLYHLASVEADWLYMEVLQQDFPADIQILLPMDMRDDQHRLTRVRGFRLDEHLTRLEQVRAKLLQVFAEMTLRDFHRPRRLPEYDVTPEWVLHHLMQHEGEHRGQITELRLGIERLGSM